MANLIHETYVGIGRKRCHSTASFDECRLVMVNGARQRATIRFCAVMDLAALFHGAHDGITRKWRVT